MKQLFTVGEMQNLFHINAKTLRYYDEIGLLKPESTDPVTGYRYYSTRQFERLNTIKYLRALDMPLEKIRRFFENKDTATIRRIMEEQMEETRIKIENLRGIEHKLEKRLSCLADAVGAETGRIRLCSLPKRRIVFLRRDILQGEDLEYPIRELERENNLEAVMFLGKVGVSVSCERLLQRKFDRFSGIFVLLEEEDGYRGECRCLPDGEYLTISYSGTHRHSEEYYCRLLDAAPEMGYVCAGDSVEITWIDSGFTDDTARYLTELQIPVRRVNR